MTALETLRAMDELLQECDTYRAAWLKAEQRANEYYEALQRLKGLTGRGEVLYAADVCKVAGISRHTLSMWQSRYPEGTARPFPKAKMEGNRRTWDRAEIRNWLTDTGRKVEE